MSYVNSERKTTYQKSHQIPEMDLSQISEEFARSASQIMEKMIMDVFLGKELLFNIDPDRPNMENKMIWWTSTATPSPEEAPAGELVIDGDWWKEM